MSPSPPLTVAKKLMSSCGSVIIPSAGYSMYPTIRPQDECLFIPAHERELILGDILLFCDQEGHLVGHRLVGISESPSGRTYTCKGDTNLYPDHPVAFDRIVGKLWSIERKPKRVGTNRIASAGRGMALWGSVMIRFPFLSFWLRKWVHYSFYRTN
ncbi:hypothetical protein [Cohnella panacarvi]|uniref:hypothetical protein n=1 Tax=Cohnella panacarvi TaxID=400776 RepID=UPI0012EB0666|nr:hypothetical protein [Cohnella panacarvi]